MGKSSTEEGAEKGAVRTLAEVAKVFRVSTKTVHDWRSRGMPGGRGSWPILEIREWLGTWNREYQVGGGGRNGGRVAAAAAAMADGEEGLEPSAGTSPALERGRLARAQLAELDLAERRKELVSRSEVLRRQTASFLVLKRGLRSMAKRIVPELQGLTQAEQLRLVQRHCDGQLREWARGVFTGVDRRMIERLWEFLEIQPEGGEAQ